jgi:ABC-type multidrug transport system ATPase subunit
MLSEAQRICDRILIIHNGTVRADGSPTDLLKSTGTDDLEDAYMALTQDVSRMNRQEEESGLSRWWLKLSMRGKKSKMGEEE